MYAQKENSKEDKKRPAVRYVTQKKNDEMQKYCFTGGIKNIVQAKLPPPAPSWPVIQRAEEEDENDQAHGGGEEPSYQEAEFSPAFQQWGGQIDADAVLQGQGVISKFSIGQTVKQMAFGGPAVSGPKDYTTSGGNALTQIAYDRDLDGAITFAAPSAGPTSGSATHNIDSSSYVDLQNVADGGILAGSIDTSSRPQHFSVADNMLALKRGKTRSSITAMRKGSWTWHHLKNNYVMVLVDMRVHKKHGHNGGVHLW